MYKIIIKNNLLPLEDLFPPSPIHLPSTPLETGERIPHYGMEYMCMFSFIKKIHLPSFAYIPMCVRARRFRKKEKGSPRKPRERENIEYKISYFIINIPFSVSSFLFCLSVLFGTPGELALIGWKIFQPIRFSCTNTIKSGGGRKTYYRGQADKTTEKK